MSYKKYLEAGTSLNKYSRLRLKKSREDEDSEDDDIEDEHKTSSDTPGVEYDSDIGDADAGKRCSPKTQSSLTNVSMFRKNFTQNSISHKISLSHESLTQNS